MNVVGLDEDNQLALCLAASDGRLKARLDAVAYWADVALTQYNSAARRRLNTVLKRVVKRDVETFKPEQVAERLAVCRVTLRCELQGDTPLDVRNPPTGPFAGLPDPMRSFCTLVDPGSYAGIICAEQAARLPPLPLAPGSVAITLNAPAHDGAGTPAAEPSAWTQIAVGSL